MLGGSLPIEAAQFLFSSRLRRHNSPISSAQEANLVEDRANPSEKFRRGMLQTHSSAYNLALR